MKKFLLLGVFMFGLLGFVGSTEASTYTQVYQFDYKAPIYATQNYLEEAIDYVPVGKFVAGTDEGGMWLHIQHNGQKAYLYTHFDEPAAFDSHISTSKSGVVIKAGMSTSSKTVAHLKYGMVMKNFGYIGNGWSFVQYGNIVGYVNARFVGPAKTYDAYLTSTQITREIASPSGRKLFKLPKQAKVKVHASIAGWSYVTVGRVSGYVPTKTLTMKKYITKVTGGLFPSCPTMFTQVDLMGDDYNLTSYTCTKVGSTTYIHRNDSSYTDFSSKYSFGPSKMYVGYDPYEVLFPLTVGRKWTHSMNFIEKATLVVESLDETLTYENRLFTNVVKIRVNHHYSWGIGEADYIYFLPGYGMLRHETDYMDSWYLPNEAGSYLWDY